MNSRRNGVSGVRVAVLAADGFEYIELVAPCHALRLAGADVEVVSLHRGRIRGMNLTQPTGTVRVHRALEDASAEDYDALFIPGGFIGPDLLRQSRLAREFVKAFDVRRKPIAAICHGVWLLVSAELARGRHLSSWPGIRDDVVHAGGIWRDEPLVRDSNWISSRGPQDLPQFIGAMLDLFALGEDQAELAEHAQVENGRSQSSPKPEHPMGSVVTAARLLPGPTLRTVLAGAVGTALTIALVRRLAA